MMLMWNNWLSVGVKSGIVKIREMTTTILANTQHQNSETKLTDWWFFATPRKIMPTRLRQTICNARHHHLQVVFLVQQLNNKINVWGQPKSH